MRIRVLSSILVVGGVLNVGAAERYPEFAVDFFLLNRRTEMKSGGQTYRYASVEAMEAAQRIFSKITFVGLKRSEVRELLGDPATMSAYGLIPRGSSSEPLVYRYDSGFGGNEYRLEFLNGEVRSVEVSGTCG